MFVRVALPILLVLLVAVLILILVLWRLRRDNDLRRQERLAAENRWPGYCEFDNPETGAKCQRQEFHLENHYRDIDGRLVQW